MTIEQILENPYVSVGRCKPFLNGKRKLHCPYRYTITYCYPGWNHSTEIHTNNIRVSLFYFLLSKLELRRRYGSGSIPVKEVMKQLKMLR